MPELLLHPAPNYLRTNIQKPNVIRRKNKQLSKISSTREALLCMQRFNYEKVFHALLLRNLFRAGSRYE